MNSSFNNGTFSEKQGRVLQGWAPPLSIAVFKKLLPNLKSDVAIWSENDREVYAKFLSAIIKSCLRLTCSQTLWEEEGRK